MSVDHGDAMGDLAYMLQGQLDRSEYRVQAHHARLRRSPEHYYVPDVVVIPAALHQELRRQPGSLDAYAAPLPLVVEIWSPSTDAYDIDEKLPQYQARGDLEIWRLHPYDRTLTDWRRQPDGSYVETFYLDGIVRPASLPGVAIDLAALFAD